MMMKVRDQNSNRKMVKQTVKNVICVSVCDVSGDTLQSCKVTPAIRNVHYQPKSLRR